MPAATSQFQTAASSLPLLFEAPHIAQGQISVHAGAEGANLHHLGAKAEVKRCGKI